LNPDLTLRRAERADIEAIMELVQVAYARVFMRKAL
jgi:hypothetical protein